MRGKLFLSPFLDAYLLGSLRSGPVENDLSVLFSSTSETRLRLRLVEGCNDLSILVSLINLCSDLSLRDIRLLLTPFYA